MERHAVFDQAEGFSLSKALALSEVFIQQTLPGTQVLFQQTFSLSDAFFRQSILA